MSQKLELYVYTTKTWQKKGLLKVGHSLIGRHEQRIKEQFNASNPESPIVLWVKLLPEDITDKHIHAQLEKNGLERKRDGSGKEWFYATLDDVKRAYNELVHGIKRKNSFFLRKEQAEAVEKARKWILKKNISILQ